MDEVKVIKAIYCTKMRRGSGTEASPVRVVTELFDIKGNLLAECDTEIVYTKADMVSFALFVAQSDWKNITGKDLLTEWKNKD